MDTTRELMSGGLGSGFLLRYKINEIAYNASYFLFSIGSHYVDQVGLPLEVFLASASQTFCLKLYTIIPST